MGNLKVAGLDIGSHNLTIDESSGTLLVDGEEVSGSGGGGISYVWANETARTATTGMVLDEQGLQQDTGIVYKYTGSAWVPYYSLLTPESYVAPSSGVKYVWIDEAAKLAQTGMSADEQGVQQDTNTVYKYDGTVWEEHYVMSDSTVQKYYEGTSAPINSKIGDEWFDQNDGTLYKRVSDGTDSVWMAINSLAGGGSSGGAGLTEDEQAKLDKIETIETKIENIEEDLTEIYTKDDINILLQDTNIEGLSTLSSPKLNVEILTEFRHPINSKPIYTKTINFGSLPNATAKSVAHGVVDAEEVWVDDSRSFVRHSNNGIYSISYTNPTSLAASWSTHSSAGAVIITTGSNRTSITAIITIMYTKTTDTSESPVRKVGGGSGGGGGDVDLTDYYTKSETDVLVDTKQDTLVSGTSIKTINGQSVLGSGNVFITAEADLSNYYTKPQVDGFINEINAELGSMVVLGEYGLRWNQETDVYEALGSVNRRQIQGNMKRCVLNDDGTVNYYLNPTNSTQKEQGGPAVLTGADGNVMVEVPLFWYKHTLVGDTHEWWVSNTPLEGYSVHPWFLEGGVIHQFRYYRAYIPTVVAGKLRSISGSTPTRNQTRDTFRTQARANGTGWELCSWNAVNAIQLLFLTEYCTFNTQAVLGTGNDADGDHGITTGQSNGIGNASSGATNNNTWMSYRGIENWYADCWEFIDGINVQNYKVFLNQNPATFADDVYTGDYVDSGVTIHADMNASYIKKISGNFLPTAVGGSSSTFVTDIGWSNPAGTHVYISGNATGGFSSGGFTFSAYGSVEYINVTVSAGLSR